MQQSSTLNKCWKSVASTTTAAVLGALTLGAALSLAQSPPTGAPPPGGPPDPEVRIARLTQELSLTPAQQPQFKTILDQEHADLMASMQQEREQHTDLQAAHQNHQKIEDSAMAKLKPLLNDEQFKKYQGIVEAEAYARHHRAPPGSPPPSGAPPTTG